MIRLVSLNVERSKHFDRVIPFLKKQNAEAVCLQELCEQDIPRFESELGMQAIYAPVGRHPTDPPHEGSVMTGICIFSRAAVSGSTLEYYAGSEAEARSEKVARTIRNNPLLFASVEVDGKSYRIATTHFTWTPDGEPSDEQRKDLQSLFAKLEGHGEFALCGDFNAPRGGEIFSGLAAKYRDNIPPHYTTSIDKDLHRAGDLQLMVDGLFTTPSYFASEVELRSGVSDHLAIVANVDCA